MLVGQEGTGGQVMQPSSPLVSRSAWVWVVGVLPAAPKGQEGGDGDTEGPRFRDRASRTFLGLLASSFSG